MIAPRWNTQYMKLIFSVGTKFFFSEFGQGVHRQCLSMLGDTAVAAWECSQQTWKHLLAVVTHGHGDIWMGKGRALGEQSQQETSGLIRAELQQSTDILIKKLSWRRLNSPCWKVLTRTWGFPYTIRKHFQFGYSLTSVCQVASAWI